MLFYIREALIAYMNQVKSDGGKEWWKDTTDKADDLSASGEKGFGEYIFRSEEGNQSFGKDDQASATDQPDKNPF